LVAHEDVIGYVEPVFNVVPGFPATNANDAEIVVVEYDDEVELIIVPTIFEDVI
jgi:hypothetical protein